MERLLDQTLHHGATPAAPYVSRPPSPPYILVPSVTGNTSMSIVPSFENADPTELSREDLEIITQNMVQRANDSVIDWHYDMRRQAQRVVDFLWLGPLSAAKDQDFLRREGITMILGALHSDQVRARLMSVESTARTLGIVADSIDVSGNQALISEFPRAVSKINEHLLSVYRSQAVPAPLSDGQIAIDPDHFRRGRVLVFCESGNDRSAAVVAAYIMTVFGESMIRTIQFINVQRFCTNFDEDTKTWLRSYEDILKAKRDTAKNNREAAGYAPVNGSATTNPQPHHQQQDGVSSLAQSFRTKRTISDAFDTTDFLQQTAGVQNGENQASFSRVYDGERYQNRPFSTPFVDSPNAGADSAMEQ